MQSQVSITQIEKSAEIASKQSQESLNRVNRGQELIRTIRNEGYMFTAKVTRT